MADIIVNAGKDPLTNKRIKVRQTGVIWNDQGQPITLNFMVQFYEDDNVTPVPPTGNYIAKRAVTPYEDQFFFEGWIDPTTMLVVPPETPGAVNMRTYFETKAVNTFPGTSGASTMWKVQEGMLKDVVALLQVNGILPA